MAVKSPQKRGKADLTAMKKKAAPQIPKKTFINGQR